MNYYKLHIQYEGSRYYGFQWQNGIETVQSAINNTLEKLIDGKFSTTAASRTDSGVHALFQVLKITSENKLDEESIIEKLNSSLPSDIRVVDLSTCSPLFRPSSNAELKEYRYFFTNQQKVEISDTRFVSNIANKLDLDLIKECIHDLKGEHDFCNFYSAGSNVKSTVRTIFNCELTEVNPHHIFKNEPLFNFPDQMQCCYQIRITASGFLKQMIRKIVSILWLVGSGKMTRDEFRELLNGPQQKDKQLKVAPPNGLFLFHISYKV